MRVAAVMEHMERREKRAGLKLLLFRIRLAVGCTSISLGKNYRRMPSNNHKTPLKQPSTAITHNKIAIKQL
jgi:hypothetical protein